MYNKTLLLVLSFFLVCSSLKNAIAVQNIHDIVSAAQKNNSSLLAAEQELQAQKLAKIRAFSGFLPRIEAAGSASQKKSRTSSKAGQVTVTQDLFSGGITLASIARAKDTVEYANAKFRRTEDNVILRAIEAYENVILTRQLYKIASSKEEAMRKHLQTAELRFSVGELTKTDVATAKFNVAVAVTEKEGAYGDMLSAESTFSYTTGLIPDNELRPVNANVVSVPNSMDEFTSIINSSNPDLVMAKKGLDASKHDLAASNGKLLPNVRFEWSVKKSDIPINYNDGSDGSTVSLSVNVPIFERGLTVTDIREKRYAKRQAEYGLDDARGRVMEDAVKAWTRYQVAKYSIESNKETLVAAQDAATSADEEYKVGAKTTLDILTAEINLARAKANMKKAEKDLVLAIFQMHAHMGNLSNLNFSKIVE